MGSCNEPIKSGAKDESLDNCTSVCIVGKVAHAHIKLHIKTARVPFSQYLLRTISTGSNKIEQLNTINMAEHVCSIIPDHMFDAIANSEHASAELKGHAARTLQHTKHLRTARHSRQGRLHSGDQNHFGGGSGGSNGGQGGGGAGGASGGGRYGHGGTFGESTSRYGHGGTYGDDGNDQPPADKDAKSTSSHGKGSIIHPQMLDAISQSSAASAETKDAALRTKAHDEAADKSKTSAGTTIQASTKQARGAQGIVAHDDDATKAAEEADPAAEQEEEAGLEGAEDQELATDDDVQYPDSDYDSFDEDDEQGYAGFSTVKSAAASGGAQKADAYDPNAVTQVKYPGLNRFIYNNYTATKVPGQLMRNEASSAPKEPSVNRAYDGFGVTYQLLMDKFGCNSLDNKGRKLYGTVHYGSKYMNAVWDGVQMKFGDGDGTIFGDFTKAIDIMAHEMTHGLIAYSCKLVYSGESGALDESCADIMGSMVKQLYYNKTAANASWLCGVEIRVPSHVSAMTIAHVGNITQIVWGQRHPPGEF